MSIMPLSEFSGEKNESRENRVMRWRERYYRQESCIAALKAQRDELLAACKEIKGNMEISIHYCEKCGDADPEKNSDSYGELCRAIANAEACS